MKNLFLLVFAAFACNAPQPQSAEKLNASMQPAVNPVYQDLANYIEKILPDTSAIASERKELLNKLAEYIQSKKESGNKAQLTFICTHNSRRSHLSQIWAATAAHYFGLGEDVGTYSGGTEATAFNPRAVAAIERAGFQVENPGGDNPQYSVSYAADEAALRCFSKVYNDPFTNPQKHFAAIMTCSDADKNCPLVAGADLRLPIRYKDPKEADNTPEEARRYDERCRQIATEMFYLMSRVQADKG